MDGNNRWSKKNNINPYNSYIKGSEKLLEISEYIFSNYETRYITAFALSKNNLKRTTEKIKTLKAVIEYFLENLEGISKYKYKINLIGDLKFLNKNLIKKINDLNSRNLKFTKTLIILLNYSGQDDVINSINQIDKKNKTIKLILKKSLLSSVPNPDILIRTGGYSRISNFMLYQISFTDLFFKKIVARFK